MFDDSLIEDIVQMVERKKLNYFTVNFTDGAERLFEFTKEPRQLGFTIFVLYNNAVQIRNFVTLSVFLNCCKTYLSKY